MSERMTNQRSNPVTQVIGTTDDACRLAPSVFANGGCQVLPDMVQDQIPMRMMRRLTVRKLSSLETELRGFLIPPPSARICGLKRQIHQPPGIHRSHAKNFC